MTSIWTPAISTPVVTDFLPNTNSAYSLGSVTFKWKNLFLSGDATIGGNVAITGNTTIDGNITLGNNSTDLVTIPAGAKFNGGGLEITSNVGLNAAGGNGSLQVGYLTSAIISTADAFVAWLKDTQSLNVGGVSGALLLAARNIANANIIFSTNGIVSAYIDQGTQRFRLLGGSLSRNAPVTKAGDFTVGLAENWFICNGGATIAVTLPTTNNNVGREIMIKTVAAFTVVSASANVVPLVGGAAGTAILAATAGKWVTLVSDGTNWIIMQGN